MRKTCAAAPHTYNFAVPYAFKFIVLLLVVVLPVTAHIGCAREPREGVVVSAAASLGEPFRELGDAFSRAHPSASTRMNFAGSQVLARQILEGAQADVFASANEDEIIKLREAGLVEDMAIFARSHLVVVAPDDSGINDVTDLKGEGLRVVVAAREVPAGKYTREALEKLGMWTEVKTNIVSNEDNVKAVLTKVLLGEADAGVVYATDTRGHALKVVEFPTEARIDVKYFITTLKNARAKDADTFMNFVLGDEGQRTLKTHGFESAARP